MNNKQNNKSTCLCASSLTVASPALLLCALVATNPVGVLGEQPGYSFRRIATLGDPAPGPEGGVFFGDFEPYALNESGAVGFAADLSYDGVNDIGEGIFVGRPGAIKQIIRAGELDPSGATFGGFGVLGNLGLNDAGEVSFCFGLNPFTTPLGANAGVYRFSHRTGGLSELVVPYVTLAPGGGTFVGGDFYTGINDPGQMVFTGKFTGPPCVGTDGPCFDGLRDGVFLADAQGHITSVVRPGDAAPDGIFDEAENPNINNRGDIGFDGHLASEECINIGTPQSYRIVCGASVYLKPAGGAIQSIAHQGAPAPGGGTYRLAFGAVLNNAGDLVFIGDLTPPPGFGDRLAVFFHSSAGTIPVVRPGDALPGGGNLVRASFNGANYHLNDQGQVVFDGALDTQHKDFNGDMIADTGMYVWSHGALHLVARTGTVLPGIGVIDTLHNPFLLDPTNPVLSPTCGAVLNNRGQVFFQAILTDGRDVLLVATPGATGEAE